jgi:hypothetical protein
LLQEGAKRKDGQLYITASDVQTQRVIFSSIMRAVEALKKCYG